MDRGICCDHCQKWYHIDCQGVSNQMYNTMGASSMSWCCLNCGIPNSSTGIFLVAVPSSQYMNPHQTRTRSNSLAYLPFRCKTNVFQNSFFLKQSASGMRKRLPDNIVCVPSLLTFKTAISHEKCSLPSH